jgi:hypothetical protein
MRTHLSIESAIALPSALGQQGLERRGDTEAMTVVLATCALFAGACILWATIMLIASGLLGADADLTVNGLLNWLATVEGAQGG